MLRSMTGFGSGTYTDDRWQIKIEVRVVNHRFFESVVRMPRRFSALEEKIRQAVQERISRGRVEIHIAIEDSSPEGRTVNLDMNLLMSYHAALSQAGRLVPMQQLSASDLLALPDVLTVDDSAPNIDEVWPLLHNALGQAIDAVIAMRTAEGRRLYEDIERRLTSFTERIERIAGRSPHVQKEQARRLQQRLTEWLEDVAIDEDRLLNEVALLAERSDINEELVRSRSHIVAFRNICRQSGSVGRKLDFLLQEMHREITTIGTKAPDTEIKHDVVEAKALLEKIREQVQNIE